MFQYAVFILLSSLRVNGQDGLEWETRDWYEYNPDMRMLACSYSRRTYDGAQYDGK
jgi:hypothetical protein